MDEVIEYSPRIDKLKRITSVALTPGNFDYNEYMCGMANGLILALSVMEDKDPVFIDASAIKPKVQPKVWQPPATELQSMNKKLILTDAGLSSL